MSIFDDINSADDVSTQGDAPLGGLRESGLYADTIEEAYMIVAGSGAVGVTLKLSDGSSNMRYTAYITSGTAKGKKTYYEREGKKYALPGFELIDNMCELITGKGITAQDTEEKVVNIYNYDAGQEMPTKVEALADIWGKRISTGVIQQLENKNVRNESTGKYEPTAETRNTLEISKFFHPDTNQTLTERKTDSPASYVESWVKRNKGQVKDKTSKDAPKAGTGMSSAGAAKAVPPTSADLFS